MRKPWIAFTLLAAAIFAAAAGVDFYRHRFVRSDRDLLRFLPQTNATIFFGNVDALRRAGILQLLSGAATPKDPDYSAFLRETHFDYNKDIDAAAGAAEGKHIFILVRGRFDWTLLRGYTTKHGGTCKNDFCEVPSSTPGRWASFFPIQSDVMALAISTNRSAAQALRTNHGLPRSVPDQPLWVSVSPALLKNPPDLPIALRIFAISLQSAESAVFSLGLADPQSSTRFELEMNARCASSAAAQNIRSQLELDTKFLKLALGRQHIQSSAADLTSLLTAGSFQVSGAAVVGHWPIRTELLNSLR